MATHGAEVPVNEANGYITNFINNFFDTAKAPVKSMIMSADLLRSYLTNPEIENVKFMLGSRVDTINAVDKEVFTLIVAGYNSDGDYVLTQTGMVLDQTRPCPPNCPTIGNAANDHIVI